MGNEHNLKSQCHINSNKNGDTFVGVKSDENALSVCFPLGYCLPPDERTLRFDVINLITVLAKFSGAKDKLLPNNQIFSNETVNFPIKAYMGIMQQFRSANSHYYTEKEVRYTRGRRGKVSWSRTIKKERPVLQDSGSFVYLDYIIKENTSNTENLITLVHEYCVYESYQKIGWLYPGDVPQKPRLQFDSKMFLGVVYEKLGHTFDDRNRELFCNMIAVIKYLGDDGTKQQYYFGTDRFEYVWERLIDFTFGIDDKNKYFPHTKWNLTTGAAKMNAALEPDTIMIVDNKIFVLDAKYYRYGATSKEIYLPESTSINKQITYGEYIVTQDKFKKKFGPNMKVYNAFLMPFGRMSNVFHHTDYYKHIGEAVSDWKNGIQEHEHVQGILIDIRYLMHNYVKHNYPEIIKLAEMIEEATTASCTNTTAS